MAFNFLKDLFDGKKRPPKIDITRRFELLGRVGQGSMSRVWRARDTRSNKIVGLKVLDKEKTKRFESRFPPELKKPTEGEIAVPLNHPHVVKTFEWGFTSDDEQFLVMEFVDGLGLSYLVDVQNDVMQKHRLSFMIQIGEAIRYVHEQKWIHRDLCPRNIMVTDRDNQVKLIDFGLVVPNTPPFQAPGNRTGTANYMAPELIKRVRTDQRIDIFSFAVTCFEMFTRRHPWEAAETLEAVLQHINSPPIDIREAVPGIDEQVAAAIMKGLAIEPRDRWQTIDPMIYQLREAQERLQPSKKAKSRRPSGITMAEDQPDLPPSRKKAAAAAPGIALAADSQKSAASKPKPKSVRPSPGIALAEDQPHASEPPRKKPAASSPGITLADDEATPAAAPRPVKPPSAKPGITLAEEDEATPALPRTAKPASSKPGISLAEDTSPVTPPPRQKPPAATPGITLAEDGDDEPAKGQGS
ncbi:MAG TPA: protein kinase [Planctomycetaceae bacterium]|jgi:serine/threonine protein kinase